MGDRFAVDARVFADISEREFGFLVFDERGQLLIVKTGLCNLADHVGLRLGEDGDCRIDSVGVVIAFDNGTGLAKQSH